MNNFFFAQAQGRLLQSIEDLRGLAEKTASRPDPNAKYLNFLNDLIMNLQEVYNFYEDTQNQAQAREREAWKSGYKAAEKKLNPQFNKYDRHEREYIRAASIANAVKTWKL